MWFFNSILNKIFEILFYPFRNLNPWFGMIFISLLTSLLMLLVFRFTSNQKGIKKVKNRIKAHLLELRLYKDYMGISLKAQGNILINNLKYIGHSARPLLVMIIPLVLILIQLNVWFGYQSFKPGQEFLLKVELKEELPLFNTDISILPSKHYKVETPPLRIMEESEINWRIQAQDSGNHPIFLLVNDNKYKKNLSVSQNSLSKISPIKTKKNFWEELFNPAERPIDKNSPVKSIEIEYPPKRMNLFGLPLHWLIVYFALSIIFAFSLKGFFKVEI